MAEKFDPYVRVIQSVLDLDDKDVYQKARYSLLHKIVSDASHSSTNKWRYRHPDFYWSHGAVAELVRRYAPDMGPPCGDSFFLNVGRNETARAIFHQEHVVPTKVVIDHLLGLRDPGSSELERILEAAVTVCIVTREENGRLLKDAMPLPTDFMNDRWARYRTPKDKGTAIHISPYSCAWKGKVMTFSPRCDPGDLKGAPQIG